MIHLQEPYVRTKLDLLEGEKRKPFELGLKMTGRKVG